MSLPGVIINELNGQIGAAGGSDYGIMGLVLSSDTPPSGLALNAPKAVFSLKAAEALGIDAAFDADNGVDVHHQIKGFYTTAESGTELWIIIIPQTNTMAGASDKTANIVKKLLRGEGAKGRVKMWGISRVPDGDYTPTFTDGIDDDVSAAVVKAHELNEEQKTLFNPCRTLIGARAFQGDAGNLKDFRQNTNNTVQVVLGSTSSAGHPAVGYALGQYANRTVQRKISRTKEGALGLVDAYLTDGEETELYEDAWNSMHDKGYVFFRKFANKSGFYFSGDPTCCPLTDDYAWMARGRVIDKSARIAYATYVEEVEDDIFIDNQGYMDPSVVKSYQTKIENQIKLQMKGEISAVNCYMTPVQNVTATNKVVIEKLGVQPKGYSSTIEVNLGYDNPANG